MLPRGSGLHWLVGAALAAALIPLLVLGVGVAFWLSVPIALLAGGGAVLMLAPRAPLEGVDVARFGRGKVAFAREMLEGAATPIRALRGSAGSIGNPAVQSRVARLATQAEQIVAAIEQDPLKLDPARRFLTYYLPRAAEMAEGYRLLEGKPLPDAARLAATRDLLERLDAAFARFGDALWQADVARLDLELKLLRASIDEDLGPIGAKPVGADPVGVDPVDASPAVVPKVAAPWR